MIKVLEVNVDDLGYGGVFSLIRTVIANKPENIQIDIAAIEQFENPANIESLEKMGTHIYYVGKTGNKVTKQLAVYKNLKRLCKKNDYDYIHIHADVANKLLVSTMAASAAGKKNIILHSHSSNIEGNHRVLKKIFHLLSKKLLNRYEYKAAACSDVAAKWMFGDKETFIIHNGIELQKFQFDDQLRREVRQQLKIKDDELLLGHVGRFSYQKNHYYLIDIFHSVVESGLSARLLLVGEGPLQDEVQRQVRKYALEDKVIFYGTSNAVNKLYQAMDVFLLPSRFEGLPVVGVEAQASGLPVLFSDKITREAKLIDISNFLPIDEKTIGEWAESIAALSRYNRFDKTQELFNLGYDITQTVEQFTSLYK